MQTQTTVVNWEDPTTWTNWQARFSAVAQCVYTVVWDSDDKRREIIDDLLRQKRISGYAAGRWPHRRDDKDAFALDEKKRAVEDLIQNMIFYDAYDLSNAKPPAHGRPATLAMFRRLDGLIQDMQALVLTVEEAYSVDCTQLKSSLQVAHTQLENYIDAEERGVAAESTPVHEDVHMQDLLLRLTACL